jgi:hypothetical protein
MIFIKIFSLLTALFSLADFKLLYIAYKDFVCMCFEIIMMKIVKNTRGCGTCICVRKNYFFAVFCAINKLFFVMSLLILVCFGIIFLFIV